MKRLPTLILLLVASCSSKPEEQDRYAGRNGKAEAARDGQSTKPAKLYSHVFNGFAPGFATPGIVNCSPQMVTAPLFYGLPEADFQEGEKRSAERDRLAASATRFARDYNRATFRAREAEIRKICPQAQLAP
jgi:hypothetical protein